MSHDWIYIKITSNYIRPQRWIHFKQVNVKILMRKWSQTLWVNKSRTQTQRITITVKRESPTSIEANGNYVWFKEVESPLDTKRGTISFEINGRQFSFHSESKIKSNVLVDFLNVCFLHLGQCFWQTWQVQHEKLKLLLILTVWLGILLLWQ